MITELCHEKTFLRGFRPGLTQTGLYNHRRWLEACNFGFRMKRDCTVNVLIFVFAYAKSRFPYDTAQLKDIFCQISRKT